MPLFDEKAGRLVLRVVYDGPAYVGKTTNITAVGEFFAVKCRSELFTSHTAANRTLYLDWLEVSGGVLDGWEMDYHFMTVPGQAALSRRRHFLLQRADVVVFVVGSDEQGLREAGSLWPEAKAFCEERHLPLILQANKQDLPGALSPESIAQRFDVHPRQVIAAQSNNGGGVRVTAIMAMRAAADQTRRIVEEQSLTEFSGTPLTGPELVQAMMDFEAAQPMTAIQVLLSKKAACAPVDNAQLPASGGDRSRSDAPKISGRCEPPLPTPEVPTGCIWPSAEGRELLRQIPIQDARPLAVPPLSERRGSYAYEAGSWQLRTTRSRCYENLSTAKDALLTLVHSKLSIGNLLAPNTVYTLQADREGRYWLWCASPHVASLDEVLASLHESGEDVALAEELVVYAEVSLRILEAAHGRSAQLGLATASFGKGENGVFHTDNEPPVDSASVDFVRHAFWQAERFGDCARAVSRYSQHLAEQTAAALHRNTLSATELQRALPLFDPRMSTAQMLKSQLSEVITKHLLSCEHSAR